jgi:tripartite-type tricarboxylate transporter receptor subunit TctC
MSATRMPGRRAGLALAALGLARPALAQGRFPDRPIRVFVPFPPGGATDVHMRVLCDLASRSLGQPVLVENKAGAAGTLGALTLASRAHRTAPCSHRCRRRSAATR